MVSRPRLLRRFAALIRSDPAGVGAGFVALVVSSFASLTAGLTLGAITGTLEELPGLLVLVPAAIGMRGNVFGALGSRLGTAIHAGTFSVSRRLDTVVGQNVAAALALSLSTSLVLAVLAKIVSVGFGVTGTISIADFLVISVLGGMLSSVVALFVVIGVTAACVRWEFDLDNVHTPIVTTVGDMVTLPSLFLATYVAGIRWVTPTVAVVCAVGGVAALVVTQRARLPILRQIVRESVPVLALAGFVDVLAGITVEKRLESFAAFPALLVLVPPFLGQSGSLGGILSSRVSTKLNLGLVSPSRFSLRPVADDVLLIVFYAVPVYLLLGVSADVAAAIVGLRSPGVFDVIGVSLLAGAMTIVLVVLIAYFAAVAAYRLGFDPDNHGIPIVTSSLDLVGAFAVILAIVALGLT
ncbi:MAG TPA: magnesium transporter [Acidimicrobiia bacterium]|nr:magnesium transporter [Acidimicrobiia bacterium]